MKKTTRRYKAIKLRKKLKGETANLNRQYTTTFKEKILAASKIESGEWKLSKASLQKLKPLIPEDIDGHRAVREAVNWVSLASGEQFYSLYPYLQIIKAGSLDILQPDINWVGGLTVARKIAHAAEAAGGRSAAEARRSRSSSRSKGSCEIVAPMTSR